MRLEPVQAVLGRAQDSTGSRAEALASYRRAWEEPLGREEIRADTRVSAWERDETSSELW